MSEHEIDIDALRQIADDSGNDYVEEVLGETIAELERLRAENARLAAEVERLRPPNLTLEQVADVFNEHMLHDADDWETDGDNVSRRWGDGSFGLFDAGDATLVAYGLLRDAAPKQNDGERVGA